MLKKIKLNKSYSLVSFLLKRFVSTRILILRKLLFSISTLALYFILFSLSFICAYNNKLTMVSPLSTNSFGLLYFSQALGKSSEIHIQRVSNHMMTTSEEAASKRLQESRATIHVAPTHDSFRSASSTLTSMMPDGGGC